MRDETIAIHAGYIPDSTRAVAVPIYQTVAHDFVSAEHAGAVLDLLHFNPIKALYWTAIINGFLAPFLLAALLYVASDRKIMRDQPSSRLGRYVVILTTVLMFGAAIGMLAL